MVVTVTNNNIEQWLQALGYDGSIGVVHRSLSDVRSDHPYAREIDLMLRKDGEIGSAAVYDVDQVPTVCFIESSKQQTSHPEFVDEVRRKIWNQNLVSIVVVIQGNRADILPAPRLPNAEATLTLSEASPEGQFSATEIASGKIYTRLPDWFNRKHRIDRVLLDNLSAAVDKLIPYVQEIEKAQLLLGKCIFVSYLEDRGIVGDRYRERHKAKRLRELLEEGDGPALHRLFKQFKSDFNGDFFAFDKGVTVDWRQLQAPVFDLLGNFLKQTHIRSGQLSL
ncbi:MAG: hypothetical protein GC149_03150 [Gammaproteobacteria bacterium]|nr:hypothetical protein [Gammaproteobacteria bacterium]